MAYLQIVVDGKESAFAADTLTSILADGEPDALIVRSVSASPSDSVAKTVDPIAIGSLILGIPGSVLAAADIVDRLRKRRKAERLIATAKQLRDEQHVVITVVIPNEGTQSLDQIEPDTVLDIASRCERP